MKLRVPIVVALVSATAVPAAHAQTPGGSSSEIPPSLTPQQPEEPKKYPWRYHRFDTLDVIVTLVGGAGFMYVHFGVDAPQEARWSSTALLDDDARDWFVADSREGRDRADTISDVLWYTPMALPWLDLAFPLFADDWNLDTAWQMTAINFQAFAVSGFVSRAGHRFVGRARPDVAECLEDPEYNRNCFAGSYSGFPSGHTSTAAVGAGLVCSHHLELGLFGSDVADGLACGLSASMAVGTGVARMAADRHYISDVIVGAAIGFGSGLALPMLRHYREPSPESGDAASLRWTVVPSPQGTDGMGLAAFGWF